MAFVIAGRFAALLHHLDLTTTDELLSEAACREILARAHVNKGIVGAIETSLLDGRAQRTLALHGVQYDASVSHRAVAPRGASATSRMPVQRGVQHEDSVPFRTSTPRSVTGDASATPRASATSRELVQRGVQHNSNVMHRAPAPRGIQHDASLPQCAIPLQAIVGGTTHDRPVPGVFVRHYSGLLPAGSLVRASPELGFGDDVYVASPDLLFVLGAAGRDVAVAAAWGMELCGTYAQSDDDAWPCIYQMKPIATIASLSSFISTYVNATQLANRSRGRSVAGLAAAQRALPYVIERSASPMETKLACLLGLSTRLGGRGFWPIEFNARLDLDDAARRVAGKNYLSLDLFFRQELRPRSRRDHASGESRGSGVTGGSRMTNVSGGESRWMPVAVEYESREFHEAVAAARDPLDRNRVTAAELSGVRMLPLTWEIVRGETRFDAFCDELARLLGKVPRPISERALARRRRVRSELGLPVWSHDDDLVPVDAYDLY